MPTAIILDRRSRVRGVTLGLSAAGAACGGLAGAASLAIVVVPLGDVRDLVGPTLYFVAAGIGAVLGAVCAPLAGWILLRHVPLGRVFAGLTLGTVIGGVLGFFAPPVFNVVAQPLAAGALGFLAAAMLLRFTHASP